MPRPAQHPKLDRSGMATHPQPETGPVRAVAHRCEKRVYEGQCPIGIVRRRLRQAEDDERTTPGKMGDDAAMRVGGAFDQMVEQRQEGIGAPRPQMLGMGGEAGHIDEQHDRVPGAAVPQRLGQGGQHLDQRGRLIAREVPGAAALVDPAQPGTDECAECQRQQHA